MTLDKLLSDYAMPRTHRPWSPQSEPYTGFDALFAALRDGWMLSRTVYGERIFNARGRGIRLYTFTISRDGDTCRITVIDSPHVHTLIQRAQLNLVGQLAAEECQTELVPVLVARR